ncbi:phage tail protein [Providencia rettgeri]|uniref:phage tail-collar fiber domain-containing protein n=1 Tax=Providencia rettgeri TaxID=587 RepID=UPI00308D9A00|nr:phage tail protein [Providencia rettgeri]
MASIITVAFENWKAQEAASGKAVLLDEFVFANVPNLDPTQPIDRNEKLPPANQIVHRQAVNKAGLASENAVAYSVTLGAEVGNFDFNWIGLLNKASGTVAMITHAPTQKKLKTQNGQQGNVLTRSFILEFQGAAEETQIKTSAETWQIDFTARLSGIDEMQRLINVDSYGAAAFFNDGFEVTRSGEQYTVKKGLGYVGGLRGELVQNQILNSLRNTKVYADFSYQGNIVSQWNTVVKITSATTLNNYVDAAGFTHQVFAIASIDASGNIKDLRPMGSLNEQEIQLLWQLANNKVSKKGDSLTGTLNFTQNIPENYDVISLPGGTQGKNYLRKFRSNNEGLIWHETISNTTYTLSTGITDLYPVLTLGHDGLWAKKITPADYSNFDEKYLSLLGVAASSKKLEKKSTIAGQDFYGQGENIVVTPAGIGAIPSDGGAVTGILNFSQNKPNSYDLISSPNGVQETNYLRQFRANSNGALWHETVVNSTYTLSTGANNNYPALKLDQGDGLWVSKKVTPTDYSNFDERYNNYLVGAPIPWPQATAPSGFLICNGQSFNKTTFPLLAKAYPSGVLPDLRGEFIRGVDAGRNVDSGRAILSTQGDAIREITGSIDKSIKANQVGNSGSGAIRATGLTEVGTASSDFSGTYTRFDFAASRVVPTANENRPRNIAFLYIVRAA